MHVPTSTLLPSQYDNYVTQWERSVINDTAVHILVSVQQGYAIKDVLTSTQIMILDLLTLISVPQSIYLNAKYRTKERAIFYLLFSACTQLNIDRSFFSKGPPPISNDTTGSNLKVQFHSATTEMGVKAIKL